MYRFFVITIFLINFGCQTNHEKSSSKAEFGPQGIPTDWGNLSDAGVANREEARLANAAARSLNQAANLHELLAGLPEGWRTVDAVSAAPVKLLPGHFQPFGDGQVNRSVDFTGWPESTAAIPLIATSAEWQLGQTKGRILILEVSDLLINTLFDQSPDEMVVEFSDDFQSTPYTLKHDPNLNFYRLILVPEAIYPVTPKPIWPAGVAKLPAWIDSATSRTKWTKLKVRLGVGSNIDARPWPLMFRMPTQGQDTALDQMPTDHRYFSNGRAISQPPQDLPPDSDPHEFLSTWFSNNEHLADFYPDAPGVHHQFPDAGPDHHHTAVGGVDTYVRSEKPGSTEVLYTCFDARNQTEERVWGVPSGAGWHSIGHPTSAETIVNSLENTSIFVGWGVQTPYPFDGPSPFEAKDVATFGLLRPGQAFTTVQGHLHWYAVDVSRPVCVVIWKHGCKPQSDTDLSCP